MSGNGKPVAVNPDRPRPINRLKASGYKIALADGSIALRPEHKLVIDYMVHGCQHLHLVSRLGLDINVPLTLSQAADLLRISRRSARNLAATAQFQRALAKAVGDLRTGAHAEMVHILLETARAKGQGTAADRKVQLDAAVKVLGEEAAKGTTVNVQVNNTVSPGYVIDLSEPADRDP